MKNLVLDLVTSYENGISMVEAMFTQAYDATTAFNGSWSELDKERERLKATLREMLAGNCSLRRKDFNALIESFLSDSEGKRRQIDEEQKRVRKTLKEYMDEQRTLISYLKEQLVGFTQEGADKDNLEIIIAKIKAAYQGKGEQVFAMLEDFRQQLEAFQREQRKANHKLQRLVDREESLSLEDLRQLETAEAGQERKVERELRRQDVERLLAHFKEQRQKGSRQ